MSVFTLEYTPPINIIYDTNLPNISLTTPPVNAPVNAPCELSQPGGYALEEESLEVVQREEHALLVARVLRGEQDAFSEIVTQYSALMLRTAQMIMGDWDGAEDVVQDALIQAWHHLADLRESASLRPWLMRIVVNQCMSFKRRLARTSAYIRQTILEQETDLMALAADEHKGRAERDWDLAQAIGDLPAKQRTVIILHYYNGMTLPEMSQALQTSENTLKKRIQATLTHLREMLRLSDMDVDGRLCIGA